MNPYLHVCFTDCCEEGEEEAACYGWEADWWWEERREASSPRQEIGECGTPSLYSVSYFIVPKRGPKNGISGTGDGGKASLK